MKKISFFLFSLFIIFLQINFIPAFLKINLNLILLLIIFLLLFENKKVFFWTIILAIFFDLFSFSLGKAFLSFIISFFILRFFLQNFLREKNSLSFFVLIVLGTFLYNLFFLSFSSFEFFLQNKEFYFENTWLWLILKETIYNLILGFFIYFVFLIKNKNT